MHVLLECWHIHKYINSKLTRETLKVYIVSYNFGPSLSVSMCMSRYESDFGIMFVVITIQSFFSFMILLFVAIVTRPVSHMELKLFTIAGHHSSTFVLCTVHVVRSFVFCLMFNIYYNEEYKRRKWLKILKGYPEVVRRRRKDNAMINRKRTKNEPHIIVPTIDYSFVFVYVF
jgi:hypothetical protein